MLRTSNLIQLFLFAGLLLFSAGCRKERAPKVKTLEVVEVTSATAKGGGQVLNEGGGDVMQRGLVWDTVLVPSLEKHSGMSSEGMGKGVYFTTMYELQPQRTYYVRAYATNQGGTGYGEVVTFQSESGSPCPGISTVRDYNGNLYHTVLIGSQCWLRENLKVRNYRDGTPIPVVEEGPLWANLITGAMCWYDNNPAGYASSYGGLYNWHATVDPRGLCPEGWRVATDADWQTLEISLGMSESHASGVEWRGSVEGGMLKEVGTIHWADPNQGANNASGFTARAGGLRSHTSSGECFGARGMGNWWSATESSSVHAWNRMLLSSSSAVWRSTDSKRYGFSVRCVME